MAFRERMQTILPMSKSDTEQKFAAINESNNEIKAELKDVMGRLAEMKEEQRNWRTRYDSLLNEIGKQQEALLRQLSETQRNVDEIRTLNEQALPDISKNMTEVIKGDIFRRIEFLQGRVVLLEKLFQSNMLLPETQKNSQEYIFLMQMKAMFKVMEPAGDKGFVRIGKPNDGGYVMWNDFENRKIAYSFGIADDVSWDADMAERGLDIFMYDHTIESLPFATDKFHYFRIGIGTENNRGELLRTLPELLEENGHMDEYGMILKMDVEGAEWDVLNQLDEEILSHFSQIVFEFHGVTFRENKERIESAIKKLNKTHQLIHVHGNNFGPYMLLGGAVMPELLEATYLLKNEYIFNEGGQGLNTELDAPNNPYLPDIFLGSWNE